MHPAYVNNIVMPSDSRSTPRLAFLYHRYLVCSEIRGVEPLCYKTGDFQRGVEYGINNNYRDLFTLVANSMGGLNEGDPRILVDEMCDHIMAISDILMNYLYSLTPNSGHYNYQIKDWGGNYIWMSILPKYQVLETHHYY